MVLNCASSILVDFGESVQLAGVSLPMDALESDPLAPKANSSVLHHPLRGGANPFAGLQVKWEIFRPHFAFQLLLLCRDLLCVHQVSLLQLLGLVLNLHKLLVELLVQDVVLHLHHLVHSSLLNLVLSLDVWICSVDVTGQLHYSLVQILTDPSFLNLYPAFKKFDDPDKIAGVLKHLVIAVPHNSAPPGMLLLLDE